MGTQIFPTTNLGAPFMRQHEWEIRALARTVFYSIGNDILYGRAVASEAFGSRDLLGFSFVFGSGM